VEKGT